MIVTFIYVALAAVLAEFFVHYCRSILAASRRMQVPMEIWESAGVQCDAVAPGDFEKFLELVRVCPEETADDLRMSAVCAYYGLVRALGHASRGLAPRVESWAEKEQRNCSHFAAVALDRRISCTRKLLTQRVQSPF